MDKNFYYLVGFLDNVVCEGFFCMEVVMQNIGFKMKWIKIVVNFVFVDI